jgi:tRNA A58 N-methylase Trm61
MRNQPVEMAFTGKLLELELTGELTSDRGSQKVSGQKQVRASSATKSTKTQPTARRPDVIYVPTPQHVVERMLEMASVKKEDQVYDLGCGDGRIVITAAEKYGCKGVGYDIARERVEESLANVEKHAVGHLVQIEQKDIFTLDLSQADVITLYLLPELNVRLIPQLEKLKPGSRIVSHDFDMRGIKPDQVEMLEDSDDEYGDHTLYLWVTPLKREALQE